MNSPRRNTGLNLGNAAVNEKLDTGDVTAVIRCQEDNGFRYVVRHSKSAERDTVQVACQHFLGDTKVIVSGCRNRSRTDDVDADFAPRQIDRPTPGKGTNSPQPAFANRTSRVPFSFLIVTISRSKSSKLETSPCTPRTFSPISLTAASSSVCLRPLTKTKHLRGRIVSPSPSQCRSCHPLPEQSCLLVLHIVLSLSASGLKDAMRQVNAS